MLSDSWRLPLIVSFLGISGIIVAVHTTGRFYPWTIGTFFVTMGLLLILAIRGASLHGVLTGGILVGVSYRLAFNFYTATPVGLTPQGYPEQYNTLIETGSLNAIEGYYADPAGAPFQDLLFTSTAVVTGLDGYYSIFLYAILVGVLYPLLVVAVSKVVGVDDHRILGIATVLALVTTEGLRRTYYPRNQMIAVLFFLGAMLVLLAYLRAPDWRFFLLLVGFATAVAYSHRLPLVIFAAALFVLLGLYLFERITWDNLAGYSPVYQVISLFVIVGALATFQLTYLGNTLSHLTRRIQRIFLQIQFSESGTDVDLQSTGGDVQMAAAEEALPGLVANVYQYPSELSLFVERGHGIWLLLVAGAGWAYLFIKARDRDRRGSVLAILAVSSVCVALMFVGMISIRAMNPTRPLHIVEPLLVVVVGAAIWRARLLDRNQVYQLGVGVVLVVLIASQVFAMAAAPDYTNSPRYYGDVAEVTAKETVGGYTSEQIYADREFDQLSGVRGEPAASTSSLGSGTDSALFNAEITPNNHSAVLYRPEYDVYHGRFDRYRLTWNPETELSGTYHRGYDNGDVIMFSDKTDR